MGAYSCIPPAVFHQAATIVMRMPVGVAPGLPPHAPKGVYPAVNGNFFLPTYGTVLAMVTFDHTGASRIGKFLLNHSFVLPGLVSTTAAILCGLLLGRLILA